jgi:hypothetical protein
MLRFLIQFANFALLALLLLGLPAAGHAQLVDWQITTEATVHRLMFVGLLIAAAGNATAAAFLIKGRQERSLCWEWAAIFGGLLAVQYAVSHGYFSFNWLKQALRWLQKHF